MFIGIKIKNLVKARGLLIKTLTEKWDIQPHHFSRMIKEKLVFSDKKVAIAAAFLGVTPDYLRDESRPFNPGDTIPPDALATPTPITDTPADLAAQIARLMERQAQDIARSESERMKMDIEVLKESTRQLASLMGEISGNNRVTSETLLTVVEIVKELKDERGGSHDPD